MFSDSPPTTPIAAAGILKLWNVLSTSSRLLVVRINLELDSENRSSSSPSDSIGDRVRSTVAPILPAMAISASVTASPPFAQS